MSGTKDRGKDHDHEHPPHRGSFAEGQETHEHHPEDTKRGDFARGEDRDTDDPDDQEEGADT